MAGIQEFISEYIEKYKDLDLDINKNVEINKILSEDEYDILTFEDNTSIVYDSYESIIRLNPFDGLEILNKYHKDTQENENKKIYTKHKQRFIKPHLYQENSELIMVSKLKDGTFATILTDGTIIR